MNPPETMSDFPLEWILPQVEKPARYIGAEWNSTTKNPAEVDLRLCLAFPDLYELGLGNLGLQILYARLNDLDGVWAERTYLPGPDMEALMDRHAIPLRMLESQEPVSGAHGLGFTLQSELTYVNVLKMIRLAGLPLKSHERDDAMPLVFAGGPGAFNPEPLAPFIDFFVLGDGEEVVVEIAACLLKHRDAPRTTRLEALAALPGVYVPALYPVETLPDGRVLPDPSGGQVRARFVEDLDATPYPTRTITPYVQLVHDGVGIEVLRGCTHGCRFCQAGMLTRPVRERSIPTITSLLGESLAGSGMEDATLVSLSTCDYSRAHALLRDTARTASEHRASLSLPSLRLDRFSVELADYVASMRRSGLTFAPEAGTSRLRAVINKDVSDDQLLSLAEEAFKRGWNHIKLYFMIGLPTEQPEDVDAIADLCIRTLAAGRRVNARAQLRLGVSTFVPKPFTPFQWAAQIGLEETYARQRHLADLLRPHRRINFGRHAPESSFIEGLLSRADRRASELLLKVLEYGGGYETWSERLNFQAWRRAIEETDYPVEALFAERTEDERFSWDIVDAQVSRTALLAEWQRAREGRHTPDCRRGPCNHCGAMRHSADSCRAMQEKSAPATEAESTFDESPPFLASTARPGVQHMRLRVGRSGRLRFLSHLETVHAWIRALRRAGAPLAYSQGFHAHPKINFGAALPVGEESEAEIMDIVLEEHRDPEDLLKALRSELPDGLQAFEAREIAISARSPMAALVGNTYLLLSTVPHKQLEEQAAALNAQTAWVIDRQVKNRKGGGKGAKKIISLDIRPLVSSLTTVPPPAGEACPGCIQFSTALTGGRLAKPKEIIHLLKLDPLQTRVRKIGTMLDE